MTGWLILAAWAIATQVGRRLLLGPRLRPELPPYPRLDDLAPPPKPSDAGRSARPPIVDRARPAWADAALEGWHAGHAGADASHAALILPRGVVIEGNTSSPPPPPPPPPPRPPADVMRKVRQ